MSDDTKGISDQDPALDHAFRRPSNCAGLSGNDTFILSYLSVERGMDQGAYAVVQPSTLHQLTGMRDLDDCCLS